MVAIEGRTSAARKAVGQQLWGVGYHFELRADPSSASPSAKTRSPKLSRRASSRTLHVLRQILAGLSSVGGAEAYLELNQHGAYQNAGGITDLLRLRNIFQQQPFGSA